MSDEPTRKDPPDADVVERLLDELAWGPEGAASTGGGAAGSLAAAETGAGGSAAGDVAARAVADSGAATGARREYLEILGLLGAAVEPIDPPPAIRERLLAEVRAEDAATTAAATTAVATTAAVTTAAAATAASAAPVAPVLAMPAATAPAAAPIRRWALPLAASLALALAGISGYQAVQLAGQRTTIDELSQRLDEVEARASTVVGVQNQLAEMRQRMALITSRGVEICALRPMAVEAGFAGPNWTDSHGVLYVAPDHQHWYLTIEGLNPCKQGRSYQLWFVPADGEPVSAGTFDVGPGVRVELSSDTMPHATRAVTITLEPAGGSREPTGPAVLHGDEVMAIL